MRNIEEIWLDFREGNPLSAEEEAVVRQYIADPQRQTFFHTLEAMSGGKQVRRRFVHNRQAGMDAILRRTRAVRRRRIGRWCTGIAAGVALLVGMMFFYHAQEHGREPVRLVERAKEEKSSARLTLANGEVVTLQGGRSGVIVEDDCRKVENSDQTLVYEQSGMMSEVGMNIVTTPVGSEYRLQLADGTKVYLNADSELSFPEIFQGATREVTLRGEAYFEVAKDSTRQFIVHTQGMQVMVLCPLSILALIPSNG